MENISLHTLSLCSFLVSKLDDLKHSNGKKLCVIYGRNHKEINNPRYRISYGPIVSFNLLNPEGNFIGYSEVEKLATLNNIHIRTGCFCNPGACQIYLGLSNEDIKENYSTGHVCWDSHDIINGKPTGAIRVSIPYMANIEDIHSLINFLKKYFVDNKKLETPPVKEEDLSLIKIVLYPIKSCEGFEILSKWPIGPDGLLFDREWTLIDGNGQFVNQKKMPILCRIKPRIDLDNEKLIVEAPGMDSLNVDLNYYPENSANIRVCGDSTEGLMYGKDVSDWFSTFCGVKLDLIRKSTNNTRNVKKTLRG